MSIIPIPGLRKIINESILGVLLVAVIILCIGYFNILHEDSKDERVATEQRTKEIRIEHEEKETEIRTLHEEKETEIWNRFTNLLDKQDDQFEKIESLLQEILRKNN